jgi:hypothetical protein
LNIYTLNIDEEPSFDYINILLPVLNDMIDEMAERLQKQHGIEEFSNVASPNQVSTNSK